MSSSGADTSASATNSPTEAAIKLESLLGEHAILVADVMRARLRSDDDLATVADAAVGENTKNLGAVLQPVFGPDETADFAKLWSAHVQMLFDYARGLSTGDVKLQRSSRKKLLPVKVGKKLDTPDLQLRSTLTKVLGEHVALVIAAMRAAAGDPKDFAAMGNAVNGNTLDLTKAIDGLFGPKAAAGFQQYWANHVDELMAYTSATVKNDADAKEASRRKLRQFESTFSTFLNTATENRLGRKALAQAFVMHDRELLADIDAYTDKDYTQAHDLAEHTYSDMYSVAGQLASAIGATLAGDLPKGGSQTGGGGMARQVS